MSKEKRDIPNIIFPPPLVFLAAIGCGALMNRLWPVPIPTDLRAPAGPALLVMGLGLVAWSFYSFHKAATPVNPYQPTATLVTTGPFRYSRNPMYLALALTQLGVGLWLNELWIILMLAPALIVIRHGVIAREECYLEQKFGEVYARYKSSVRRWV